MNMNTGGKMSTIEINGERRAALDRYLQLDLTSGSAAAQDLYGRATREAALPELSLTGDGDAGSVCGHLTPGMSAWLSDHVLRARQGALAAVEAVAGRARLAGGVQGIVDGIETDRFRRNRNQRRTQEIQAFYERHHGRLHEANQAEAEYLSMKAYEGGREALTPSLLIDLVIPAAIMIPEFFMNYVSFTKLAGVPAIGFGLSAVVALAVALSAFMAGSFFKAYSFYMNADREERRSRGLRQFTIAAAILAIAMCAVAYARYHMVLDQWEAAKVIGLPLPNVAALTLGLLAGNLLVFALGAGITFMIHDENPEYARKAKRHRDLAATVERLKRKQLDAKLQIVERGHRQDVDRMGKMWKLMEAFPESHVLDEAMADIAGKDTEVIGLLNNYRSLLVERLVERDDGFLFKGPVTDRYSANGSEALTLNEFNALPLHLYRSN